MIASNPTSTVRMFWNRGEKMSGLKIEGGGGTAILH